MAQTASDSTLSFLFDEEAKSDDGLCDPFANSCRAEALAKARPEAIQRPRRRKATAPATEDSSELDPEAATYTFRWDVEVPLAERGKCGPKFMKQWKRVLQAQKLTPLVSAKLAPYEARFQLCMQGGGEAELVAEREREISEELAHLRRDELPIAGEPTGTHPAGWQGVRVWMTFARRDVETALAKKPRV